MSLPPRATILRLESWSNSARTLLLRGLAGAAPFTFEHVTNADRSRASDDYVISEYTFEIPVILSIEPSAVPVRRGECYVRLTLLYGTYIIGVLSAAYVTDSKTITWPPGILESSIGGQGRIYTVTGTNPAAAAQISETVPANARWRLRSIVFSLATDGNAANRSVNLKFTDGTNDIYLIPDLVAQTASSTFQYQGSIHGEARQGTVSTTIILMKLPDIILFQGYTIETTTPNMQAGDDYTAPIMEIEEWIEE